MTCIAGIIDCDGTIYFGSDSEANDGWNARLLATDVTPKVFKRGELLFGCCGSLRSMNLLRHRLVMPEQGDTPDMDYILVNLLDAVRKCFKDGGFIETNDGRESGELFLVGYRGKIYRVNEDLGISVSVDDFSAIGVGAQAALGALMATSGPPEERLRRAITISAYFTMGVGGAVHIVSDRTVVTSEHL